jgi:hypothetical protein
MAQRPCSFVTTYRDPYQAIGVFPSWNQIVIWLRQLQGFAPARVYNSTDMEVPRRRWIPVTFLIWLGLFALAAELNSDRPNMGDPRWSRQWWATYPDGEGMFYAWVLPALGIVWTLALLLRVPSDERIGRRRMFWAWMKAGLGMGIVLGTIGSYVSDFKAADVGSLNAIATWMSLAFFLVIVSVALVKLRARWPAMTVRTAGLIGSAAALAIGAWFYWVDLPDDGVRGLKGTARADALIAKFDSMRGVQEEHRAAGVGYKMLASGDRVDLEVAVPWAEADAERRERIAELWNHPSPVLGDVPKPPWHAEWRTPSNDPQSLVFSVRQPADRWEVYTLLMATSEAQGIATQPWDDLRQLTSTLVDERYSPPTAPNPGPQESREILQVTLLHLAIQLDRLAQACDASSTRTVNNDSASQTLRSAAARAREFRDALVKANAPLSTPDLVNFGEHVTELGRSHRWSMRPDGCEAVHVTEEYAFGRAGDAIVKHATVFK